MTGGSVTQDLSLHPFPVSELFYRPASRDEWTRYRMSDEQVSFFHEHGYVAGVPVLNSDQVAALRGEVDALTDPSHSGRELFYEYNANESTDPATILFHALGAWRVLPGCHDALWNPAFLMPAFQLLKSSIRFWHDQIFYKPARHGGVVAWHQDYSYWTRTKPMAHLSCWIGLDDSTVDNGCVHYVPGSHKWDLLPVTGLANNMEAIRAVLTPSQRKQFNPVAVELKKGEASFHHPLMVHGSFENRTELPRRALVLNVFADGVVSASDRPPLEGVPPIVAGQKMAGQFFPLLFDPEELS